MSQQPPRMNDDQLPVQPSMRFPTPPSPQNPPAAQPILRLAADTIGVNDAGLGDDVIARFVDLSEKLNRLSADLGGGRPNDGNDDRGRPRAA